MDRSAVAGNWDLGFREISIVDQGDMLVLTCPDGPPGYEGRLLDTGEDRYRIEGGPLHGAELVIGSEGPMLGGSRPLTRLDRPAQAPPGSGLSAPPVEPDPQEERSFERAWNWLAHPSHPPEVDLGGIDVSRFVLWLTQHGAALFHGSNRMDLDALYPDSWPTVTIGSLPEGEVVYATGDGLCSMFLALLDEGAVRGARHRVERFYSDDGTTRDVYHFSAPSSALESRSFRPGGLYLLPRERFEAVPLYPGGPLSGEFVCTEPVRPLACLMVAPDDFPLRESIGAYD